MLCIAALYFAAAVDLAMDSKWGWAGICLSWGIGGVLLALEASK